MPRERALATNNEFILIPDPLVPFRITLGTARDFAYFNGCGPTNRLAQCLPSILIFVEKMSSQEAEALVISTDPLHVRFQIRPSRSPHSSGEVACKSDTRAVSFVLPGNYIFYLTSSVLINLILHKAWVGNWNWRRHLYSQRVGTSSAKDICSMSDLSLPRDTVYIAPSGVQKERIEPIHIFVLPYPQAEPSPHTDRVFLRRPALNLKESACTPLFWNSFDIRDAGSCIHTHSQHAVMATLLWTGPVFTISHQVSIA